MSTKDRRFPWLVITLVAAMALAPVVLPSSWLTPLNYIGIQSIVCLGLVLMTGMAGITSFGQAAFVGIAAYASAWLVTAFGFSPWASLPLALLASSVAALALGTLTIGLSSHYLVLGTMAWGLALFHLFGNLPMLGGYNGIGSVPRVEIAEGLDIQHTVYVLTWALAGLVFLGARNLLDSRQGRAIRSLRDALMASSFGVPVARLKVAVFTLAAALAGLSGWLYVHYVSVANPGPFGIGASIDYLFMAVVGGSSSIAGALIGPAVVESLRTVVRDVLPGFTGGGGSAETVLFGIIVLLLLQGSSGGVVSLLKRWLPAPRVPAAPAGAEPLPRRPSATRGAPLLQVQGLGKRFGGLVAVAGLDFELASGEILGLIGPNGAGKSTLFNLLTGVLEASVGTATFQGQRLTGRDPRFISRLGIARTFQHVRLRPDMSVIENVALGCYGRTGAGMLRSMLRLDRAEEARSLNEAQRQLERVGLAAMATLPAGSLALGQQRVVEIARALAADPLLLMLDEPAAGLRRFEKQQLADVLHGLRLEGVSILLVEHDMDFVMNLVDRLVVLQFGQLIASGTPATVKADPRVIEAYLGGLEGA